MKASSSRRASLLALLAAGALSASSFAVTLDPVTAGTGVSVTGSGAAANGPVELIVNDVSLGSVVADGSGNFSFTADIVEGDDLQARVAQTWDFGTDAQGWAASGPEGDLDTFEHDPVTGTIKITETNGDGNITFVIGDGDIADAAGIIDPALTRVWEARYKVTSATWNGGGGQAIWYSVGPVFPNDIREFGVNTGFFSQYNGTWQTTMMDASVDIFGNENGWTTATPNQIIIGANGFTNGDTWEFDYIGFAECFQWEFNHAGDAYNWGASANSALNFPGSILEMTSTAADSSPFMNYVYANFDSTHQSILETAVQLPNTMQAGQLEYFNWLDTPGYADNDLGQYPWTADYTMQVKSTDLVANTGLVPDTDWGGQPATLNNPTGTYSPCFANGAAGQVIGIDYIRLCPSGAFGVSDVVTATSGASVGDWHMME